MRTNPSLGLDVSGGGMGRLRKSPTLRVLRLRRWTHPHDPRWRDEHCLPIGHRSLPIHPEPVNMEPLPVISPPSVISHQTSEPVLSKLIFGRFSRPPPKMVWLLWYYLTAVRGGPEREIYTARIPTRSRSRIESIDENIHASHSNELQLACSGS
jgi:hypothetical protein